MVPGTKGTGKIEWYRVPKGQVRSGFVEMFIHYSFISSFFSHVFFI